jgi:hypothetical protein
MKLKITPENIIFDYLFYSIVIPKDKTIQYSFPMEIADTIGHPPAMIILSENKQIKYKFGFIGRLMYWVEYIIASSAEDIAAYGSNERTMVRAMTLSREVSLNKIKETLQSLKANGYEVAKAEAELQKIISAGPDKKLQEGTVQWRKDKLKLFRNVILVVTGMFAILYFRGDFNGDDKFIIVPIFIFGIIALLAFIVIFSKSKNIIWKLAFAVVLLLIIGKIIDIFYKK